MARIGNWINVRFTRRSVLAFGSAPESGVFGRCPSSRLNSNTELDPPSSGQAAMLPGADRGCWLEAGSLRLALDKLTALRHTQPPVS